MVADGRQQRRKCPARFPAEGRAAFGGLLRRERHEAVYAAIVAGDPDAAEHAMRAHILDAWERRRPGRTES